MENYITSYIKQGIILREKLLTGFQKDIIQLDQMFGQIKNINDPSFAAQMDKIEQELKDLYLFASKGKTVTVYAVFNKKVKNFGYIYHDTKSWEEEAKKK